MAFQDCHYFFELRHVIFRGEQRPGELPYILGRTDGFFVRCHPVEDSEDDLPKSGCWLAWDVLRTTSTCM